MHRYLRPTAAIAADVILPADPGLAMALAQRLMEKPLMANHHHGLWGYSGRSADGRDLTVQASGIGAPSAAAVIRELAGHGARRVLRIGTCAALDPSFAGGDRIVVNGALGADGTTAALGAAETTPDPALTELLAGAGSAARVVSHDLGAGAGPAMREAWAADGIAAVDMETAALFAQAERVGLAAAAALVVVEAATGATTDQETVTAALLTVGDAAAAALAAPAPVATVNLPTP